MNKILFADFHNIHPSLHNYIIHSGAYKVNKEGEFELRNGAYSNTEESEAPKTIEE